LRGREARGTARLADSGIVHFTVDEGLPIAYEVLAEGVPVFASGGEEVGTVEHVVAAPEEDIFHGIVFQAEDGSRFVHADQIASLQELPSPHGGAPAWRVNEPGVEPTQWRRLVDLIMGRDPRSRSWSTED
jgi:hypothetical protein